MNNHEETTNLDKDQNFQSKENYKKHPSDENFSPQEKHKTPEKPPKNRIKNNKANTAPPKRSSLKYPLKRNNTKSPKKQQDTTKENFRRQLTFIAKKKNRFLLDEDEVSSGGSPKDDEDISFIKKRTSKIEIYDHLIENNPDKHMKVFQNNRFSTVIDTKSFCLTLKQNEIFEKTTQQSSISGQKVQKVRSNSIIESVFKHLVGKSENNVDLKSTFKKQMSMRYPPNYKNTDNNDTYHRQSLFTMNKTVKNQDPQETNQNILTSNLNKSPSQSPIELSPTLKNDDEDNIAMKSKNSTPVLLGSATIDDHLKNLEENINENIGSSMLRNEDNFQRNEMISLADSKEMKGISTDFTLEDFMHLKTEIEREKKILEEEIKNATMNKYTNVEMKLKGKFVEKWTRAKWNIKAAARMRRLNDDIKCYGSSFNVAGIQQKMANLEGLFVRQKTLTDKLGGSYILKPDNIIRSYWSYIVIFLLIYTSYITPYRVVFVDSNDYDAWFYVETTIDVLFFIDILITLNSAYQDEKGKLVTNRCSIFITYLKTWLLLDLLGIFPFYLIEQFLNSDGGDSTLSIGNNYNDLLKFLRLPRLYRLIRIARLVKFIKKAKNLKIIEYLQDFFQLNAGSTKLVKFVFTVSICVHITGCMWYFIAKIQDFGPDTWVAQVGRIDDDNFSLYLTSIYWAFATLATVGYGDIHAFNDVEFFFSMIWMVFGAGFYSFTLGSLSSLLANLDTRRSHLTNKLMLMDEFCKENKFPKSLKQRVKKALEYSSVKNIFSNDDKNQLLNEFSTDLRYQIAGTMFSGLSNKIPFFKKKDKCFIANFVPLLNPLKVLHKELIYRKDEYPNLIYFLYNGRVNYVVGTQNIVFKSMVEGSYFGEIEVYENRSRYFNCRAEVDCDLLTISSDKFVNVMKGFPEHENEIKTMIHDRKKRNEIALERIKNIAPISINSEFWKKKKERNLYESVKMQRLKMNTINLDQNISVTQTSPDSKYSKFRRFFTNIFTKNRTSLTKQNSQESENNLPQKPESPVKRSLNQVFPEPSPKIVTKSPPSKSSLGNNESPHTKISLARLTSVTTSTPLKPIEEMPFKEKFSLKIDAKNPILAKKLEILREKTKTSSKIHPDEPSDGYNITLHIPKQHTKPTEETPKEKDEHSNLNSFKSLFPEPGQDNINSNKTKKRVTIKPPETINEPSNNSPPNHQSYNKTLLKKPSISTILRSSLKNSEPGTELKIPSEEVFYVQPLQEKKNASVKKLQEEENNERQRSKTECKPRPMPNDEIIEQNGIIFQKSPILTEMKEENDILRTRSRTEYGKSNTIVIKKDITNRKFSAFKNREITKILESFSQAPQKKTQSKKEKAKEKKFQKKLNFLEKNLILFKKSVSKQSSVTEYNEKTAYDIQNQLKQVNQYLQLAVKRNQLIKKDTHFKGFFLKKNTFNVGEKQFAGSEFQRPSFHQKNLKMFNDRLDLQDNLEFPEPENFLV